MNTDVNTRCHFNNTPGTHRRNRRVKEIKRLPLREPNTETGRQTTQTNRTDKHTDTQTQVDRQLDTQNREIYTGR